MMERLTNYLTNIRDFAQSSNTLACLLAVPLQP